MSKYTKLSDFEINMRVAAELPEIYKCSLSLGYVTLGGFIFDPCNNPSDAMPIINKYGISLIYQDGKFQFATHDGNIECSDNNPLRASMIILLCMLDGDYEP